VDQSASEFSPPDTSMTLLPRSTQADRAWWSSIAWGSPESGHQITSPLTSRVCEEGPELVRGVLRSPIATQGQAGDWQERSRVSTSGPAFGPEIPAQAAGGGDGVCVQGAFRGSAATSGGRRGGSSSRTLSLRTSGVPPSGRTPRPTRL